VKANAQYVQAFTNPSSVDASYAFLFAELAQNDKTVLVLKSTDYILVPGQNFLVLPAGFQRGDLIELDVRLQPIDNSSKGFSAIGTTADLPDLNYYQP
jgi:hypothetical protein